MVHPKYMCTVINERNILEKFEIKLPGGCTDLVYVMKAKDAARAAPLASQPGPKSVNANTPIAAHPI